eukprot:m.162216 g.162216  ORF g.162216 m.162216 type:complete len:705 (+) comp31267_c0_seq1:81-2195(+)
MSDSNDTILVIDAIAIEAASQDDTTGEILGQIVQAVKQEDDQPVSLAPSFKLKHTGIGIDLYRVWVRPGILPMYKHCVPRCPAQLKDAVIESRRVQNAIGRLARERGVKYSVVLKEAETVVNTMGHNLGHNGIRMMGYMLHKVLCAVYQEVRVNESEIEALKEAVKDGPVLILPNHRSYMDFLIVSYIFFFAGVPVPAIAAGEDFLGIGPVSWLLRRCGAFFMRRSFKEDPLYWACFSEYVQTIVSNGDQPVEFFVEGTRSRTGKSLHPKVGLLGAAVRPYFEGKVPDINCVAISITYEERMEAHLYADEMLGTPKPKENIGNILKARNVMKHNHGRMHVKIGKAISIRSFLEHRVSRARHTLAPGPTPYNDADKNAIGDLNYEVIRHHQLNFVVTMPVILSALTMCWRRDGLSEQSIEQTVDDCCLLYNEVRARGYQVDAVPRVDGTNSSSLNDAVKTGLESWLAALNPAVTLDQDKLNLEFGTSDHPHFNTILLSHLRNELLHVFAVEALVLMSVIGANAPGKETTLKMIDETFVFLHKVLYNEVIVPIKDADTRASKINEGLTKLQNKGLVQTTSDGFHAVLSGSPGRLGRLMLSLLTPYVECYSHCLTKVLTSSQPLTTEEAIIAIRDDNKVSTTAAENLSSDSIKNAFGVFVNMGVLNLTKAKTLVQSRCVVQADQKLCSVRAQLRRALSSDSVVSANL